MVQTSIIHLSSMWKCKICIIWLFMVEFHEPRKILAFISTQLGSSVATKAKDFNNTNLCLICYIIFLSKFYTTRDTHVRNT